MSKIEAPILHTSIGEPFSRLDKDDKRERLSHANLSITTHGAESDKIAEAFQGIQELGFTPVKINELLQGMAWLMRREQIVLPSGNKQKQERGKMIGGLLKRIDFEQDDENNLQAFVELEDGGQRDIIGESAAFEDILADDAVRLAEDPMVLGKVLQKIKELARQQELLAFEENVPGQIPVKGPRIILYSEMSATHPDLRRKADHSLTAESSEGMKLGVLKEVVRQTQIDAKREELAQALENREIITVPKFRLDNWPTDALMGSARAQVAAVLDDYISSQGIFCDPQDLKYQTLFRLTTQNVADAYTNGQELEDYLQDEGAYRNWRNILGLDRDYLKSFRLRPDILLPIIEEQAAIIKDRLENSSLPVDKILPKSGIFAEPGWVIQKRGQDVFAAQEDGVTSAHGLVPLEFREVDPELAKQFHNDLHYIHTPRADVAFGLYERGEDLPFSVLALERIDRPYKQNMLLVQGYDPKDSYDLTRLYSRPGTPGNTSSSMFSLTFNYMKHAYPETQAVVSAFMPSYASGISMTSGGFDNPVLIKPLVHTFEEREVDGEPVWEHVTKRRQEGSEGRRIRSKFPLLPTVELMTSLQSPRYEPLPEAKDFMIEVV